MAKELRIQSDDAYEIAHALAREQDRSVAEVVETALKALQARQPENDVFSAEAIEARYHELKRLAAETAAHKLPGATSDHSDMYDEFGLPK